MEFKQWLETFNISKFNGMQVSSHYKGSPRSCYICDNPTYSWCNNCLEYCCIKHREMIGSPDAQDITYLCSKCLKKAYKSHITTEPFQTQDDLIMKRWTQER